MCVYACVRFSTFSSPISHNRLEISIWNLVHQWSSHNDLIVLFSWELMPDLWFDGILNFLKNVRGSSNFRKIRAIVLKLHTNILYRSRNFGIEFGHNRLKHSNFARFWIFWEFSQNFVRKYWVMCDTKFYKNRTKPLFTFLNFLNFFYRDIKF